MEPVLNRRACFAAKALGCLVSAVKTERKYSVCELSNAKRWKGGDAMA
jgi:hypothetical protein